MEKRRFLGLALLVEVFEVIRCYAKLFRRCWKWLKVLVRCFPFPKVFSLRGFSSYDFFPLYFYFSVDLLSSVSLLFKSRWGQGGTGNVDLFSGLV